MQNRKDLVCGMIGIVMLTMWMSLTVSFDFTKQNPCPIKSKRQAEALPHQIEATGRGLAPSSRSGRSRPCPIKSKRQVEALPVKSERWRKQREEADQTNDPSAKSRRLRAATFSRCSCRSQRRPTRCPTIMSLCVNKPTNNYQVEALRRGTAPRRASQMPSASHAPRGATDRAHHAVTTVPERAYRSASNEGSCAPIAPRIWHSKAVRGPTPSRVRRDL